MWVRRFGARRARRYASVVLAGLVVLGGCSGGEDEGDETNASDTAASDEDDAGADTADAEDAAGQGDTTAASDEEQGGLCEVVAGIDLGAAYADTMTFGELDARSERACVIPIEEAGGEGLTIQLGSADVYDLKVAQGEQQSDFEVREPDLGQEAVLIGDGDLTILLDDEQALRLGLSAIFMEGEPPPGEVQREGITSIAEQILAEL